MNLITLKTFDNSIKAHLLKTKLESEGLICFLFDEHTVNLIPLNSLAISGIKLKIREEDAEKAMMLLHEWEGLHLLNGDEQMLCPDCGSEDILPNFKSFRGFRGALSFLASFLFLLYPIYFKTVYRCKDCGCEFRRVLDGE